MAKSPTFLGSDTQQTYRLIAWLFSNAQKRSVEPDVQVVIMEQKA